MSIRSKSSSILITLTMFGIGLFGIPAAHADQTKATGQVQIHNISGENQGKEGRIDAPSEISYDSNIVTSPSSPQLTTPTVSAMSVIDVLKWVCRTTLTVVGIGAWITTVYTSGGVLVTVSTWIVKYVTIPTLICNWL